MPRLSRFVSLHPYFKIHEGQLEAFKATWPKFVEQTRREEGCLFYEFTIDGDHAFCREGYTNAAAALNHLTNVRELLEQALTMADLARLEVHGPAAEIETMKEPLAALNVQFFACDTGLSD